MAVSTEKKGKNMLDDVDKLTGVEKAAILLISLGVDGASSLLKKMRNDEIEELSLQIAKMKNVSPKVVDAVMREFYDLMSAKQYIVEGGIDYAKGILAQAKGSKEANELFRKLEAETGTSAFGVFQSNETNQIAQFLQNEHPQVAALILSQLRQERSAEVLSFLDDELQGEITYRLASMDKISSEVIDEIEEVIKEQMGGVDAIGDRVKGGASVVASILNEANISVERNVIKEIEERDPQLAEEIKKLMFLFEDIAHFDDRTVQLIINELDKSDLVLGLKGVTEELTNKFLKNMSTRAVDMLKEDMEALGPVHVKDVEEAQQRIIQKIKKLEEAGQITTRKMSDDEIVE
ncbi:flagellar motor switch protein FliG [Balneolaceae bacterium ANBcel3]|nr:flagellar motor switch protein FliG [Balneolaceae bacterium ANBcel3]